MNVEKVCMKDFKNTDLSIVIPTLLVTAVVVVTLFFFPVQAKEIVNETFTYIISDFGWLYYLSCMVSFVFLLWVTFSKFGDMKLGLPTDKPVYSNLTWAGMLFTSGVGSSAVILGFLEPVYYIIQPPFHLEPFSTEAYEFAHMYGQFHWGPSAWIFYVPAIVALSVVIYKFNANALRMSSVTDAMLTGKTKTIVGKALDILVMFAITASISTSLGLGVPIVSQLLSELFNVKQGLLLDVIVISIWILLFSFSVFRGLDKGIKLFSDINMVVLFVFLVVMLALGPTVDILKMEINSIGLYFNEFIRINTWTDPFGDGKFLEAWTVFYWGWWLAFMPMMALFIVRISKGRTLKEVLWQQLIWGSFGCWCCFAIFGGYSLFLEQSGLLELSKILTDSGQNIAFIEIIKTLPIAEFFMAVVCVLLLVFLSTTIDSAAYVLASCATKDLHIDEQPSRPSRIFWASVLGVLSVGLLVVNELRAVQTISLIAGLPMIAVQGFLCYSGVKLLKKIYFNA